MSSRKSGPPPIVYILGVVAIAAGVWHLKDRLPRPGLLSGGSEELVILGDTFSGYSTFRAAEFNQELEQVDLSLRYENEFDQAARAASLESGNADLIVTTLDQYLKHQPEGQIVGLIDRTVGADAVVLNTPKYPQLRSLNDLAQLLEAGQPLSLVYAADTPSEFLAQVLDIRFDGFNLSDFNQLKVAEASEAWADLQEPAQNIAVAVLWEPFVTQARNQGHTVVLSSQDAPNAILDVIVASERLIENQGEQLTDFLSAYYRRMDQSARDDTALKTLIQTDGNLSASDADLILDGIDFFTSVEAEKWMQEGLLAKRIDATAAILVLSGQLAGVPVASELYSNQFMAAAVANTQSLIQLVQADDPELAKFLAGEAEREPTQVAPETIQASQPIGDLEVRGEVKFGSGSAQIEAQGQQTLGQLATEINEFNTETVAIRVIGHTSQTGSAAANQQLSQRRAQAVVNYLKSQAVNHNILAEGKGFSEPLPGVSASDPSNQRTEIRLVRINQ